MKSIDLEGYGKVMLNPVDIKDKDYAVVDSQGNPLKMEVKGSRSYNYVNSEGVIIPSNMVCKQFIIDDEVINTPKLKATSKVDNEDIAIADENSEIYNAIERKIYNVFTDSEKIKQMLKDNKTFKFPLVCGNGWKVYNALLTNWGDRMVMVGCRGDINTALSEFNDDTCELEMDIMPQKETAKNLLKAVAYR